MADPGGVSTRMGATLKALLPLAGSIGGKGDVAPGEIDLAPGENMMLRSELLAMCKEAIDEDMTLDTLSYPKGFAGEPALVEALSSFFNTYFHPSMPLTPEHIVPTTASGSCLDALAYTICDVGDSVLVPAPHWWGYGAYFRLHANVNVVPVHTPKISGSLTTALIPALEAAYASAPDPKRIKALVTSNPNYPFMQCYPPEVLRGLLDFCQSHDLHYISDEIFANTVFDKQATPFVSALSLLESGLEKEGKDGLEKCTIDPGQVHVVWSASKGFGCSGIRMGCVISHNKLVRAGVAFLTIWQTSSLSTTFLTSLLKSPILPSLLDTSSKRLAASYQIVEDALKELGLEFLPASAGLWVNAKVNGAESSDVVHKLKESGLKVGSGTEFNTVEGEKGWIKLSFSLPEDVLREGMVRLKACLGPPDTA
ncbi:MAG: hypothetical protein M1818_001518 [Claussenomyces sp. TS43310]|nr:MAG: hypothetical protein M1818_001518 [Claussenomyces sp. TS43310]